MTRTVQEWADFLGVYVVMGPNGSYYAFNEKPRISISFHEKCNPIVMGACWEESEFHTYVGEIPSYLVDTKGRRRVEVGGMDTSVGYYPEWSDSLVIPENLK